MRALQRPGPYLALRVFAGYTHLGDNRQRIYYCCQWPEWTDYMSNVKIYCVIFLLAGTILSSSCSGDSNPPKVDSESDSTAISATETVTLVSETNKGVETVATVTPSPNATPTATATATAAPIVFVDRNWSVLTTPVSYYVSVAPGVGPTLSRNGTPMLVGRAYCSYDSPSLNWGQEKNGSLNIIGVGTGDCYGWSVEGIATEGRRWIPNTHIEVLEFVDQNWTSFSLSTKVVNAEVGGQGNSTGRNAAQLFSDCSYDSPVLGEYPQTSPALVIGKGTGICTGWYVVATRSQNVWLHGSKLQAFAASVATASPAPTQAPTTSPSPSASPSPEPTYRHLNGDRIPATTDAGTDTCDARFLETAFCIELLPYTGITAEHLQKTVDGLQAIVEGIR